MVNEVASSSENEYFETRHIYMQKFRIAAIINENTVYFSAAMVVTLEVLDLLLGPGVSHFF